MFKARRHQESTLYSKHFACYRVLNTLTFAQRMLGQHATGSLPFSLSFICSLCIFRSFYFVFIRQAAFMLYVATSRCNTRMKTTHSTGLIKKNIRFRYSFRLAFSIHLNNCTIFQRFFIRNPLLLLATQ